MQRRLVSSCRGFFLCFKMLNCTFLRVLEEKIFQTWRYSVYRVLWYSLKISRLSVGLRLFFTFSWLLRTQNDNEFVHRHYKWSKTQHWTTDIYSLTCFLLVQTLSFNPRFLFNLFLNLNLPLQTWPLSKAPIQRSKHDSLHQSSDLDQSRMLSGTASSPVDLLQSFSSADGEQQLGRHTTTTGGRRLCRPRQGRLMSDRQQRQRGFTSPSPVRSCHTGAMSGSLSRCSVCGHRNNKRFPPCRWRKPSSNMYECLAGAWAVHSLNQRSEHEGGKKKV